MQNNATPCLIFKQIWLSYFCPQNHFSLLYSMDEQFRLDRNAFKATTAKDADYDFSYWQTRTYTERLNAAFYLIYKAYGVDQHTKLDRSVFSIRKR
jgi:hypothetical protein